MKLTSSAVAAVLAALVPVAAAAAPARHLEYGFSTYPTVKVGQGSIGSIDGPGTGRMSVDFAGTAADGGRIVEVQEWWWNAIRPEQARTCDVHSDGGVTCDQYPTPTLAENVLLPLLAGGFAQSGEGSGSWNAAYTLAYPDNFYTWSVAMNTSVTGTRDGGRVLDLAQTGFLAPVGGPNAERLANATIAYDRTSGVPISVHEERAWTAMRSVYGSTSIDLKLLGDSAAQ